MSRIRSVHPGLFTDEKFMEASPLARVFFIGIWTECDDQGSFEWSPLKLKARILPADNCNAAQILAELEHIGFVVSYQMAGRRLGVVRNFKRWQRPKKPNAIYPQTDEVREYAETGTPITGFMPEPVPDEWGTGGELLPNRWGKTSADGGGRREEGDSYPRGQSSEEGPTRAYTREREGGAA